MSLIDQNTSAGITVAENDRVRFQIRGIISGLIMRLCINLLFPDGRRSTIEVDVTDTAGDRSRFAQSSTPLGNCMIVSASVQNLSGTVPKGPGEVYCQAFLDRGPDQSATILAGYFHRGNNPAFPGKIMDSTDGPGRVYSIATADPAAGNEVAVTAVPTNARWRLLAFTVQLVQGITQTPLPTLRIRSLGTTIEAQIPITTTAIGASSTAELTWARGIVQSSFTAVVGDEFHTAPVPDGILIVTDDVGTITDGIGANTNYGAALITVEEWIQA